MKKEQFFGFLKAPFSRSFIISYLFSFFFLFSVPLLSHILSALFRNIDMLKATPEDEVSGVLITLLKDNIDKGDLVWAGFGLLIGWILISSYSLLLTHKTAASGKDVFDAERLSLNLGDILWAVPKFFGYSLLTLCAISFFIFVLGFVCIFGIVGAMKISVLLGILACILCIVASVYLFYKILCYFLSFHVVFYKEFRVSCFFERQKINAFFKAKKKNILISWLLFFVATQMLYTLYGAIGKNLLQISVVAGMFFEALHVSNVIPIAAGMLVWNFVFVYLTLLQAIVFGKIVVWIEKSKTE